MFNWTTVPNQQILEKTVASLKANGIEALVLENGAQAKEKVLELLPRDAQVMTMSSVTLDTIGLSQTINDSSAYEAVKPKLYALNRKTQADQMQKMGAAPEWTVGSVHAVTEDGKVLIASNTGSQLPAYAYGSQHVIWVVGAQKIVKNLDAGFKRLYEYILPLESERMHKVYGVPGSNVSKILIVQKEIKPSRITLIFVKEVLGF